VSRAAPPTGRILIGAFLISAFVVTTVVLLFVITAEQLQTSIATADVGTLKVSVGSMRQNVNTLEHYYKISGDITRRTVKTEGQLYDINTKSRAEMAQLVTVTNRIRAAINFEDTQYIRAPLEPRPFQDDQKTSDSARALVFDHAVAAYFAQYYAALEAAPPGAQVKAARKSLDAFKDRTYASMRNFEAALSNYNVTTTAVQSLQDQLNALRMQEKELMKTVAPKGSALANAAYWNLCEDFYSFKSLVGDWAYHIVLLPKMMLVLILSIFMGILGSLIFISQNFLKHPDQRTFWDILFRIGLGAGVAFALFFFAAAGMVALSQAPATGADQSDLSPYLISFLGITGGYLSDRVMAWMRQIGEETFRLNTGEQPPRWTPGLSAALSKSGLSAAGLAAASDVDPDEVHQWLTQSKPVPGDRQKVVAAYLRDHPANLFTDIAPPHAAISPQSAAPEPQAAPG
jgi:hypothetical protein